jgi:predicted metalloprotease
VRLELQADCYAGVWGAAARKRGLIDTNDVDAGIRAAQAVGDDRIMKQTQGYVVPDAFTHGSAEQRARWFKTGLDSGDPRRCDTFSQ